MTHPGVSQRLFPPAESGDGSSRSCADLADRLESFGDIATGSRHRINQRIGDVCQLAFRQLGGQAGNGRRGEQGAREVQ